METMEPVEKGKISRRAVIAGGAVGTAAFWSVPVIDSITSRAAAASGVGLSCGLVYVFYQHADKSVNLVAFMAGPAQSVPCNETAPQPNPCAGGSLTCNVSGFNNSFTIDTGGLGIGGFPCASASGSGPHGAFKNPGVCMVGPHSGGGACQGQFVIMGNVISATGGANPSDVILAVYAIPNSTTCTPPPQFVCPSTVAVRNSVDLSGICTVVPTG
jgi:hypothetical protein